VGVGLNDWIGLLPGIGQKYQIDPALLRAIIMVESSGNEYAARHEKGWKWLDRVMFFARAIFVTQDTEEAFQKTSWGLMQVMGSVAREHGFVGPLNKLHQPSLGIDIGARHLAKFLLKYKDITAAVASYNAGSPVVDIKTGRYANAEYVAKVMGHFKSYGGVYERIPFVMPKP